ncbi:VWA domain-containing protein [Catellatospora chokoriensis]|uniref:VWA domain containing CoxE-like protein n=1 Tax=Catellatospora chokoriensis TaxID=310353 RepID=A0A8J3K0K7_9ACTN|nr:VWA domain-containing protein [Catellatospora chokoriensis]GIF90262.1 hypothetical protein Cch02nite_37060 [Catellatospora chokoriensis]
MTARLPDFLYEVISHVRRQGLLLGIDECVALRRALSAGFGLESDTDLVRVCVALWATTREEGDAIRSAFARTELPRWNLASPSVDSGHTSVNGSGIASHPAAIAATEPGIELQEVPALDVTIARRVPKGPGRHRLPAIPIAAQQDPSLIYHPHYPLSQREIAQIWRRLRRPRRDGPAVELDPTATLHEFARSGVATPPMIVATRRNTASVLVLVDRRGSMTPFHDYTDHVLYAITKHAQLDAVSTAYFRNVLGRSAQHDLIDQLPEPWIPALDAIARQITPLRNGRLYRDAELVTPLELNSISKASGVLIISDAGAARGCWSATRVVDTVAMLATLRGIGSAMAWLNPLKSQRWSRTTAEHIARQVPMFSLTREGMYAAVDVLRGRPAEPAR